MIYIIPEIVSKIWCNPWRYDLNGDCQCEMPISRAKKRAFRREQVARENEKRRRWISTKDETGSAVSINGSSSSYVYRVYRSLA